MGFKKVNGNVSVMLLKALKVHSLSTAEKQLIFLHFITIERQSGKDIKLVRK